MNGTLISWAELASLQPSAGQKLTSILSEDVAGAPDGTAALPVLLHVSRQSLSN